MVRQDLVNDRDRSKPIEIKDEEKNNLVDYNKEMKKGITRNVVMVVQKAQKGKRGRFRLRNCKFLLVGAKVFIQFLIFPFMGLKERREFWETREVNQLQPREDFG